MSDDIRALLARLDAMAVELEADADRYTERAREARRLDMPATLAQHKEAAARRAGKADGIRAAAGLLEGLADTGLRNLQALAASITPQIGPHVRLILVAPDGRQWESTISMATLEALESEAAAVTAWANEPRPYDYVPMDAQITPADIAAGRLEGMINDR